MFHTVDEFDGSQNIIEWIRELERASDFAEWDERTLLKVVLIRLKGEASEFVSHLQEEGKAKTWENLKTALKDRYQTTRREQWHQFLLNTGQQEGKTVQEWAQQVRKLSLASLTPDDKKVGSGPASGSAETGGGGPTSGSTGNGATPKNPLLDYIRRTNFIRGLRPTLRRAVWRKHCATFDEAVSVAAEEESVEATTHEAEVLSSYREMPKKDELIEALVAALEIRDENKRKGSSTTGAEAGSEGEQTTGRPEAAAYPDQLPLPRPSVPQRPPPNQAHHLGRGGRSGTSWTWRQSEHARTGAVGPAMPRPWSQEKWDLYRAGLCFHCRMPGHITRDCDQRAPRGRMGNERRRPL